MGLFIDSNLCCAPQRLPALNDVKAKIKALTAELDKYTAETQLMARMDVLERREKEEREQAALLPEVQVWLQVKVWVLFRFQLMTSTKTGWM